MNYPFRRSILIPIVVIAVALGAWLVMLAVRQSLPASGNNLNAAAAGNADFAFSSQRSTSGHPVFISSRFHFRYSPEGEYGYSLGTLTGSQLLTVSVSSETATGIDLMVYANDQQVTGTDVALFRAWRKANLYDDPNDPITLVTLGQLQLWKATQADGIDSRSKYYYLVRPDFIYVFITAENSTDSDFQTSLMGWTLTS